MNVLLVEDDAMLGASLVQNLRQEGHRIEWLQDGLQACDALRKAAFDLVLLDLGLAGCDGIEVLRDLRARDDRTPVVILTARDQEFKRDIETLVRIADALPAKRFKTFLLVSKLSPFTADEIECAKALNAEYKQRAILLTERELEPYHVFERTKAEFDIDRYAGSPEDLAKATAKMYFSDSPATPEAPTDPVST